jgi:CBS domain containing-hemolysin-like protein
MSSLLSGIGLVALLVLLNGYFVAAEFALVSVRRSRMEQLANEGSRGAKSVLRALDHLDTYIAATQLGITMASLALGFIGESTVAEILEPLFARFLPQSGALLTAHSAAIPIAFAFVTVLHIVLGELAPKSIALQRAELTALRVTGPLDIFLRIFRPFIVLMNATGNAVVRLLGLEPAEGHANVHSVEELSLLVHDTAEAGLLEEQQERMVEGVFDFRDTTVRRLMTPRLDITGVEADATVEELIDVVSESGHSRIPVYDDDLDNIIGVVHIKDVLRLAVGRRKAAGIREVMRTPIFVPENKRAGLLLAEMRRNRTQLAVVRDEYGTVIGIVTIEDLIEEIVGDIKDEYDHDEPVELRKTPDGAWLADARLTVEELNSRTGCGLPTDEADTVGGLVFALVGRQPQAGEGGTLNGTRLLVEATDGKRILTVRIEQAVPQDPTPQTPDPSDLPHS